MAKVSHFEVPADDLERAKNFYREVFQWQIHPLPEANFHYYQSVVTTPTDDHRMPKEPGAINGGMYKRSQLGEPTTIVIDVPSIDEYLEKVKKAGGKVVLEKQPISDFGFFARIRDTENNLVGLWESRNK